MSDVIEKRIELNAPVSRVWRALTDHREFGEWFRVKLDDARLGHTKALAELRCRHSEGVADSPEPALRGALRPGQRP